MQLQAGEWLILIASSSYAISNLQNKRKNSLLTHIRQVLKMSLIWLMATMYFFLEADGQVSPRTLGLLW